MFDKDILKLDCAAETDRIVTTMREQVLGQLRRRGAVVGISGGIDSSVVAALCVRAFGKEKVLGLFMPEHHSSDDALMLGRMLAGHFGIEDRGRKHCTRPRGSWLLPSTDGGDPHRCSRIW